MMFVAICMSPLPVSLACIACLNADTSEKKGPRTILSSSLCYDGLLSPLPPSTLEVGASPWLFKESCTLDGEEESE